MVSQTKARFDSRVAPAQPPAQPEGDHRPGDRAHRGQHHRRAETEQVAARDLERLPGDGDHDHLEGLDQHECQRRQRPHCLQRLADSRLVRGGVRPHQEPGQK